MSEEMSPIELKVARQIEYYFGDHNLPRDKFLKEQLQLDDGWVPLVTMLKFNRLKSITSNIIISALQKSKSGLLEISEDKTKIRRSLEKPLPEINDEYKDALKHKSVYMKGFPLGTTLDEIQEWLNTKGNVENIQMRKDMERQFKGSVFICFDTEESSKQFLERSDIKTFKDNELLVLTREAYHAKKAEERKQHKAETKAKVKQDKEQQEKHVEKKDMDQLLEEHAGALLMFSGELEDVSREDFHEVFSGHGRIKWVDFTRGAKEGTLLFDGNAKEAFEKAKEANDGELKVKNNVVTWKFLEGEEEKEVLKKIIEAQQETLSRSKGRGGRGKFGGRGGRGGRRGRGGRDQGKTQYQGKKTKFDSDDEEAPAAQKRELEEADGPAAKVAKTENGS
ncbi:lupus La protein [Corythoichthys intestinalis]|uniref:lupus La protein n=1 Tax=Corythoichthys intestinalis TaxID=161448 RepID=UPI0025A51D78|nr:lupus La protein [Corythoichthys intestinalis]XP_057709111.1 lupus La protein [Corythoichthys intestinalis]XP_061799649.1 lupus La protein [Nerophis lumbriciformis]